jgi:transposase-like protein
MQDLSFLSVVWFSEQVLKQSVASGAVGWRVYGFSSDRQSLGGGVSDLHFGSQVCHIGPLVKEVMMVLIPVFCPHCQSDQVIKGGKTQVSKQRYKCQNAACPHYSFQLDLTYKGRSPEIKDRIIEMALNGSGIRDTARVLKISPTTVINELKKKRRRSAV